MVFAPFATEPIVIARGGCSALRPTDTVEAYHLAIEQGADYLAPRIVSTKDGVLIARPDNELSRNTDVAEHTEFAERKTTKTIDGKTVTGWFSEDFTWSELRTLHAREPLADLRKTGAEFLDEPIPTAKEVFSLAKSRRIGIYPEIVHPSHFRSMKLPVEGKLVKALGDAGFAPGDRVFIGSFETGSLAELKKIGKYPLVQMMASSGGPADGGSYVQMRTVDGLKTIKSYATGIAVEKTMLWWTSLLDDAKRSGLLVHAWAFQPESNYVIREFRDDARSELRWFLNRGVDGVLCDLPDQAVRARRSVMLKE